MPRPWITILFDHPDRMHALALEHQQFAEYRVKETFQVVSGVLARFIPSQPGEHTLVGSFGRGEVPMVGAGLELSGGDPESELRTGACAPDPAINQMSRQMARDMMAATGNPNESTTDRAGLRKVRAIVRQALLAAPHATHVIVPEARSAYTAEEFVDYCGDNEDRACIPGRQSMMAYGVDNRGRWIQTAGNIVYGIPDVGMSTVGIDNPLEAAARIFTPLEADMKTWGYAPPHGEFVQLDGEQWRVSRRGGPVWLYSPHSQSDPAARDLSHHMYYQASFYGLAAKAHSAAPIVQAQIWKPEMSAPLHRVDVMDMPGDTVLMTTNGVGNRPRPGFGLANHGCIEIYAQVGRDGPRIAHALTGLADCAHACSPDRPFLFYDRLPFPEVIQGIAGVVLAPQVDINVLQGHPVTWCCAVPLTVEELDRIRAGVTTGKELVTAAEQRGELPAMQRRWDRWEE